MRRYLLRFLVRFVVVWAFIGAGSFIPERNWLWIIVLVVVGGVFLVAHECLLEHKCYS